MIVIDNQRTTAVVIRNNGIQVTLVPMSDGKLVTKTLSFTEFRRDWVEADHLFKHTLDVFFQHAEQRGATGEAKRGLIRLRERDALVGSLF